MTATVALALLAAAGSTAASRLLRQARWLDRSPVVGIVLWQALSVSVLSAALLAGASLALPAVPLTTDLAELLSACASALRAQYSTPGGAAASAAGSVLVVAVVSRVGYCLVSGLADAGRQRRRQRAALLLVGRPHERSGALVVDHAAAAAYCLPGRRGHVVLTSAAVAALDRDQLAAVLAHEHAHLRARHHLVLAASGSLARAFPWLPVFRDGHEALTRLVEMHADDVAARRHERRVIATALVRLAEFPTPAATLAAGGSTALARVRRMAGPSQPLGLAGAAFAALTALLLVGAPAAIAVAPAAAAAAADVCYVDLGTGVH